MRSGIVFLAALAVAAAGCATTQPNRVTPIERGAAIAEKLGKADGLGAKECAPRALAKAYVALDHVMHEFDEAYYPDGWLEPRLAAAEKLADDLLAERKLVASLGRAFRCAAGPGKIRAPISRGGGSTLAPPGD